MNLTPQPTRPTTALRLLGGCVGLLLLGACASPEPPSQALQAAESAIGTAERARVADYAAPELGVARDKLLAAHHALELDEMLLAERLARSQAASRLDASGKGENAPVAGNDAASGRQLKRRVEVIISNTLSSLC